MAKAWMCLCFLIFFYLSSERNFIKVNAETKTWCVAKPSSDQAALLDNINYACSHVDCRVLSSGCPCYSPGNLINHASVAMNLYYQANGRNYWNCNFKNSGLIVITNPTLLDSGFCERMMMTSCRNIDLGTSVLDLISCGCGRRQFLLGNFPKAVCTARSYGGRNLVFLRRDVGRSCKAVPTKPKEISLVNGIGEAKTVSFDLRQETSSKQPISLANLFEVVADDLQTLNDNLLSIVGAENPVLISAAEQIFGAGGKRMRPGLVFLVSRATAELAGLKELTTEHRRLGEIIEMIHTASLIHDDVLDESDMRRGKETVHELFGTRVAVLAGDFMFAQASWYLANLENLEVIKLISQVIKDFASGEIKQASSLFDCDVTLEDYLLKSYYKTASLVAASTKGAAIFSRVDTDVTEQMYEFGKNLGLSFQVVDDILDFTQSSEQLGKPAGSDLAKGNLTAPVIFALEKEPRLREIIESEFCEEGSLEEGIELVREGGGIRRAQELAREKADEALKNLQCLPQSGFRSALEEMVMFNLERID
ncbi:unnamed protein product [Brassica rapa]|uniref:all-trans-nonaprenyl-diphosphate synthase [geranylgeranyl-diphosphatespecific] n=2 Tax=Brassica campestris TaxID=3711 RepID=A0A8D9HS99_BRACM|nr:unnamed protein product [Brassica rapa]